jgi:transcriptional regulator with XRE-family HTH domain
VNTVTTKRQLLENCRDPEYREALVFENVYTGLCSQIRVLREQRDLSQAALGRKVKMAQERISILEDPNAETKPTLKTLLRMASGFDLGLDVRFVSIGTILDRSVETNPEQLSVPSFDDELPGLERQLEEEEAAIAATIGSGPQPEVEAQWKSLEPALDLMFPHTDQIGVDYGGLDFGLYDVKAFPPAFAIPFENPFPSLYPTPEQASNQMRPQVPQGREVRITRVEGGLQTLKTIRIDSSPAFRSSVPRKAVSVAYTPAQVERKASNR